MSALDLEFVGFPPDLLRQFIALERNPASILLVGRCLLVDRNETVSADIDLKTMMVSLICDLILLLMFKTWNRAISMAFIKQMKLIDFVWNVPLESSSFTTQRSIEVYDNAASPGEPPCSTEVFSGM